MSVLTQAVGAAAKQGIIRNAQNSICHVKQVLGRTFDNSFVTDYKRKSAVTVSLFKNVLLFRTNFTQKGVKFMIKYRAFSHLFGKFLVSIQLGKISAFIYYSGKNLCSFLQLRREMGVIFFR